MNNQIVHDLENQIYEIKESIPDQKYIDIMNKMKEVNDMIKVDLPPKVEAVVSVAPQPVVSVEPQPVVIENKEYCCCLKANDSCCTKARKTLKCCLLSVLLLIYIPFAFVGGSCNWLLNGKFKMPGPNDPICDCDD